MWYLNSQARQAYFVGDKILAREASAKGQLHNRLMKVAQSKAAELVFQQRSVIPNILLWFPFPNILCIASIPFVKCMRTTLLQSSFQSLIRRAYPWDLTCAKWYGLFSIPINRM